MLLTKYIAFQFSDSNVYIIFPYYYCIFTVDMGPIMYSLHPKNDKTV